MSGPKCGHYQVVSVEEQRRRRLAAAQDRYSRVSAAVQAFQGALSAAVSAYGSLTVLVPRPAIVYSQAAEDWERASESLTTGLETAKRQLEDAVREARVRTLSADSLRVSTVLVEESHVRSAPKPAMTDETLTRVLARLPAETSADVVARCEALARSYRESPSQAEQAKLLDGIRLLVQVEQDRKARVTRNSAILEELYRELDGLNGDMVNSLRGVLKGLDRSSELPAGLRDRVVAAKAAAEAERDREFVLAAAASALQDLGYAVGEDFRTAVPSSTALLDLPHSSRHGLQIRERNHQLMLNVVRFDEGGNRDPLADKDAEESFCRDFARLKDILRQDGVDLTMLRADAPGQTPMRVLRETSRIQRSSHRVSAPREQEKRS